MVHGQNEDVKGQGSWVKCGDPHDVISHLRSLPFLQLLPHLFKLVCSSYSYVPPPPRCPSQLHFPLPPPRNQLRGGHQAP